MQSDEIRARFLNFFKNREHTIIPSASLVPENDPSVLFNTAGMQPLMPYLLGESHPSGQRLVNIQKCVRTVDLDEVGDATHLTFFEMMGNWSLGDYFKEEAIKWSYEFLTSKEEGLGLDLKRLYITVFGGNDDMGRDVESVEIWKSLGIPEDRIYFKNSKSNWWSAGPNSPAGPSTEMFYDLTGKLGDMDQDEFEKAEDAQDVVEIWNDVFMVFKQEDGKVAGKLPNKNVDTGSGLERITTVVQGKDNIFDTDLFREVMVFLKEKSVNFNLRSNRIIADHFRSAIFIILDGVVPDNHGRGYILRRLLRRIFTKASMVELSHDVCFQLIDIFIKIYGNLHPEIKNKKEEICKIFTEEEKLFKKPLDGILTYRLDLEAARLGTIKKMGDVSILKDKNMASGLYIYTNFETFGNPIDLMIAVAKELGYGVDEEEINKALKEHQEKSRTASVGMFKGGLVNHNEKTIQHHTAHHLLLAALQDVVGPSVKQRGSNISEERLRMDFLCDHKLTDEEKQKVEDWVNDKIKQDLTVTKREMPRHLAEKIGAEMEFGVKYADTVTIYFIGPGEGEYEAISKEFCGGPHVTHTKILGTFKILKEEAVAKGIRRIKAILQ